MDEREQSEDIFFLDLREKLMKKQELLSKLRSAKSEDMEGNLTNIHKWNLFLQLVTSSYNFADYEEKLRGIITEINTKLDMIERKFSESVIKDHEPKFYENKKKLVELAKYPTELQAYFDDDSIVSGQIMD